MFQSKTVHLRTYTKCV